MNAADLMKKLDEAFDSEAATSIDAVFQYEFDDDENHYAVVTGGTCEICAGDHDSPTVTLKTDVATLAGISDGSINGMQAFMTGKLKASGNVILAQKMSQIFPQ